MTGTGLIHVPDAPCVRVDPEIFFATTSAGIEEAKAICRPCPYRRQCLYTALISGSKDGVWAATSPAERQSAARRTTCTHREDLENSGREAVIVA